MRARQALSGVFLLVSVIASAGLSACSAPGPPTSATTYTTGF